MSVEQLDFLNQNSYRNYPIKDNLSKLSTDGIFTIPDDFLVDLVLCASSDVTKRFYISRISNYGSSIVVDVSDNSNVYVGSFTVATSSHTQNKDYFLVVGSAYTQANGKLTVGGVATMITLPAGIFTFAITATEFLPRTCIPSTRGINRIIFSDNLGNVYSVTGDVNLVARSNMRLTFDEGDNSIVFDAGNGLGLNSQCDPEQLPIRTINGISPDVDGNFTLDGTDCAEFTVITNGLLLQDVCSQTCVGCEEGGLLTERFQQIDSDLLLVRNQVQALLAANQEFQNNLNQTCNSTCDP